MKTIYLHIGMPKTGTSAVQVFLGGNQKALAKKNYCFPHFSIRFLEVGKNRNGHFLKYVQTRQDAPDPYNQCMKELKEDLKQYDNIILSEETIWAKQTIDHWWESIQEWAAELDAKVKIVVYLRRQDELMESMWNQKIKGFMKWTVTFDEYLDQEMFDFLPMDYYDCLKKIEAAFGRENLIVRPYDFRQFKGGTVFEDFLDAVGLEMTDDFVISKETVNASLPADAIEVKRLINQNTAYQNAKGINFFNEVIMEAYPIDAKAEKKQTFFTAQQKEKILSRYQEGNAAIARDYLGKADGVLFTQRQEPEEWGSEEGQLISNTVRVLSGADLYLYKEIMALKEENAALKSEIKLMKLSPSYRIFKKLSDIKHGKKALSILLPFVLCSLVLTGCSGGGSGSTAKEPAKEEAAAARLTNVSYDPTRELYANYNEMFEAYYKDKAGVDVEVIQSHGGSGSQARSVVEGADADVVTLALEHDITLIENAGLIEAGWQEEFDSASSPYTSTIVFLVRKGNEKDIHDWDDLAREGIEVIHPDPKSSGGACWNFLAAWYYADQKFNGDDEAIKSFLHKLYSNVTVMDSGARGSTTTFVENGQGDVLVAWENEAIQTLGEYPDDYEIVSPTVSILAQPSVAIVDENADKNGTQELAKEYLTYLYSKEAQKLIAEMGYRPLDQEILSEYPEKFDLSMQLCTVETFGGWNAAFETYFSDGGVFDEIMNYE